MLEKIGRQPHKYACVYCTGMFTTGIIGSAGFFYHLQAVQEALTLTLTYDHLAMLITIASELIQITRSKVCI